MVGGAAVRVSRWASLAVLISALLWLLLALGYLLAWPGNWWPLAIPAVAMLLAGLLLRREARREEEELRQAEGWQQGQTMDSAPAQAEGKRGGDPETKP
ncbi:MAG: hypothetical protein NTV14_01315 [Coprothermobacterota bacterium]|nr:hypothetical protein [Coprothermobacterota bacterium]